MKKIFLFGLMFILTVIFLVRHSVIRSVQVPQSVVSQSLSFPLYFETNQGQSDSQVKFISRGHKYQMLFTPQDITLALKESVLKMDFVGGDNSASVIGLEEQIGKSNYFVGNDPSRWIKDVAHFAKVKYEEIYPGIDLVFYGNQQQLEYDLIAQPGAKIDQIEVAFDGAEKIEINKEGDLVLKLKDGDIVQKKPRVYQDVAGEKALIDGKFIVHDNNRVSFEVAAYDTTKALMIDPVIRFSTYLGGNSSDFSSNIAVDFSGNIYVAGRTNSTNFPTAVPLQAANAGGEIALLEMQQHGNLELGGQPVDALHLRAIDLDGGLQLTEPDRSALKRLVQSHDGVLLSHIDACEPQKTIRMTGDELLRPVLRCHSSQQHCL